MFSFDGEPEVSMAACDECGQAHESVVGFVLRDGGAYAVYWADWHPHRGEAWVDVAFGSFDAPAYDDHVTFGCRIGRIPGQAEPACSLVTAAHERPEAAIYGVKLSRADALEHAELPKFWGIVDWLMINDATLHKHIYRTDAASS